MTATAYPVPGRDHGPRHWVSVRRGVAAAGAVAAAALGLAACGGIIGSMIGTQQALRNAGYQSVSVHFDFTQAGGAVDAAVSVAAPPTQSDVTGVADIVWHHVSQRFDTLDVTVHGTGSGAGEVASHTYSFAELEGAFGTRNPSWNRTSITQSAKQIGYVVLGGIALVVVAVLVVALALAGRKRRQRKEWGPAGPPWGDGTGVPMWPAPPAPPAPAGWPQPGHPRGVWYAPEPPPPVPMWSPAPDASAQPAAAWPAAQRAAAEPAPGEWLGSRVAPASTPEPPPQPTPAAAWWPGSGGPHPPPAPGPDGSAPGWSAAPGWSSAPSVPAAPTSVWLPPPSGSGPPVASRSEADPPAAPAGSHEAEPAADPLPPPVGPPPDSGHPRPTDHPPSGGDGGWGPPSPAE